MVAGMHHGSVRFQPDRIVIGASDRDNPRPVRNVALPGFVPPDRNDRSVGLQPDRMVRAAINRDNVRPAGHVALPV